MANLFQQIQLRRPRKNKFNLSHERKMAFDMGQLVPCMIQEVVPGDQFRVRAEVFMRFQPLLAPIMHNVNVYTHYFFVPNRLVWDEWEDFITGGREGTSAPVVPYMTTANAFAAGHTSSGGLYDYMGMPSITSSTNSLNFSALPFRAYQLIFDEYFRDQNLQASLDILKTSGEVTGTELNKLLAMRRRAWEKDYFTSALPWAQRGPDVLIPIEGEGSFEYKDVSEFRRSNGDFPTASGNIEVDASFDGALEIPATMGTEQGRLENLESVDFENTSVTINELRRSIRLQEWLEKSARAGARYVEQILAHFGVRSSDARLQRPEFLGGGRTPVRISEVLSTYQDPDENGNPQANMAGHGVSFGAQNGFRRFFEEHGYVIGVMSVIPKTAYQQGVPRHLTRFDKFDYYWPEFAHIGEQEVKQKEIFFNGSTADAEATFGYQSRYAEYKYGVSTVHGEMKSTLNFWHLGRIFETPPSLNQDFVTAVPSNRIFAVQDSTDKILVQVFNKVDALRPMPYFGTPTL